MRPLLAVKSSKIIQVQNTAGRQPFDRAMLYRLLDGVAGGTGELWRLQGEALE